MVYRRMKGRGGLFPAKRFINRAFQNEEEGVFVLPFAAGIAEAKRAVEYVRRHRNSRTLCELQSAGVPPAAAGDVVPALART